MTLSPDYGSLEPIHAPDHLTPEQRDDHAARDRAFDMAEALSSYARGRWHAAIAIEHGDERSAREARAQAFVALHRYPDLAALVQPDTGPVTEVPAGRDTLLEARSRLATIRDSTLAGTALALAMERAIAEVDAGLRDLA